MIRSGQTVLAAHQTVLAIHQTVLAIHQTVLATHHPICGRATPLPASSDFDLKNERPMGIGRPPDSAGCPPEGETCLKTLICLPRNLFTIRVIPEICGSLQIPCGPSR